MASPSMGASVDHLAVAASSLEAGALVLERWLGVPLSHGGQHARMGTHNRLLRLGPSSYLELIAIDPAGAKPEHPRWFELDDPATQGRLATGPRLVHWVARVETTALPDLPIDVGPWEAFQRGELSWRLTVRPDGTLPADGVVPSLISWPGAPHPAALLPDVGVTLEALELMHPHAPWIRIQLDMLGLDVLCTYNPRPQLVARLATPGGPRILRSDEAIG